jgi:hypothetical protein
MMEQLVSWVVLGMGRILSPLIVPARLFLAPDGLTKFFGLFNLLLNQFYLRLILSQQEFQLEYLLFVFEHRPQSDPFLGYATTTLTAPSRGAKRFTRPQSS